MADRYQGTTDITVNLLVMLREPTTDSKKLLRARMDSSDKIRGDLRVALLSAMQPMLFHAGADVQAAPPDPAATLQLDDDMAEAVWRIVEGRQPAELRTEPSLMQVAAE